MADVIQQRLQSDLRLDRLYNSYLIQVADYDAAFACLATFIKTELLNDGLSDNTHPDKNTHPDLRVIKKENTTAKGISVQQIRDLQKFLYKTSVISGKKVAVIIGAELMNLNAANSCLKILEDTPSGSYLFLLTKNIASILPTIRSRCAKINMIDSRSEPAIDEKYLHPLLKSSPLKIRLDFIKEFASKDRDSWTDFATATEILLCRLTKKVTGCNLELTRLEEDILSQFDSNTPEYLLYKFEKVQRLVNDTINFDLELQASSLLMIDHFRH